MIKIEKVINDKKAKIFSLADLSGDHSRSISLKRVLDGESDITNLPYSTLQAFARGLGVSVEDILDDFDLDGTSGQINTLKRVIKKIMNRMSKNTPKILNDKNMYIQVEDEWVDAYSKENNLELNFDKPFVYGTNIDRFEITGEFPKPFPFLKKDYYFIDPDVSHSEQYINYLQLNSTYLDNNKGSSGRKRNKDERNVSNLPTRLINTCSVAFIYTPMPIGGDLKVAISAYDYEGYLDFSEVYGVEFMNTDTNKNIVYYKGKIDGPISPETIETIDKKIISENEFYRCIQSQFTKLKISK